MPSAETCSEDPWRILLWHVHVTAVCDDAHVLHYDNALAETINGLYNAELIHRRKWKNHEAVELAALEWLDWLNHKCLPGPIEIIPPAEAEAACYRQQAGRQPPRPPKKARRFNVCPSFPLLALAPHNRPTDQMQAFLQTHPAMTPHNFRLVVWLGTGPDQPVSAKWRDCHHPE